MFVACKYFKIGGTKVILHVKYEVQLSKLSADV